MEVPGLRGSSGCFPEARSSPRHAGGADARDWLSTESQRWPTARMETAGSPRQKDPAPEWRDLVPWGPWPRTRPPRARLPALGAGSAQTGADQHHSALSPGCRLAGKAASGGRKQEAPLHSRGRHGGDGTLTPEQSGPARAGGSGVVLVSGRVPTQLVSIPAPSPPSPSRPHTLGRPQSCSNQSASCRRLQSEKEITHRPGAQPGLSSRGRTWDSWARAPGRGPTRAQAVTGAHEPRGGHNPRVRPLQEAKHAIHPQDRKPPSLKRDRVLMRALCGREELRTAGPCPSGAASRAGRATGTEVSSEAAGLGRTGLTASR